MDVDELESGFVCEDSGAGAPADDGVDLDAVFGRSELDQDGLVDGERLAAADAHARCRDIEDGAEVALDILATDAAVSPLWMSIVLHAHRRERVGPIERGMKGWMWNGGGVFARVPSVRAWDSGPDGVIEGEAKVSRR